MKTSTEELLAFVTVIDSGSITAAAENLQQTVSGVSRALTRLEKKLDATLVRRTTRRLQLTEEGELFLVRARAILAAMEEAEESIARQRERPAGRLRVDAASPFMLHCIAPHMTGVFRAVSGDRAGTDQQRADRRLAGADGGYRDPDRRAAGFDAACALARQQPAAHPREPGVSGGTRRAALRWMHCGGIG